MTNTIDKCYAFCIINLNKAGICRRADIEEVFSVSASALDCTVGYAGVNNYELYCSESNLAGVNYCKNLDAQIQRIYISFGGTTKQRYCDCKSHGL